jgi:hypothetical protein
MEVSSWNPQLDELKCVCGGVDQGVTTRIGKHETYKSPINAPLGSVTFATVKKAVLTFDANGLIGGDVMK